MHLGLLSVEEDTVLFCIVPWLSNTFQMLEDAKLHRKYREKSEKHIWLWQNVVFSYFLTPQIHLMTPSREISPLCDTDALYPNNNHTHCSTWMDKHTHLLVCNHTHAQAKLIMLQYKCLHTHQEIIAQVIEAAIPISFSPSPSSLQSPLFSP